MRCLSLKRKGRVKPEAVRWHERLERRRLENDGGPFATNLQVMGLAKTSDEEEMLFGRNVPQFEGLPSPPKLEAICFPQRDLR